MTFADYNSDFVYLIDIIYKKEIGGEEESIKTKSKNYRIWLERNKNHVDILNNCDGVKDVFNIKLSDDSKIRWVVKKMREDIMRWEREEEDREYLLKRMDGQLKHLY